MNLLRGIILLSAATLTLASCAKRPGYDRPMNQQRLHGFHRGDMNYGRGASSYYNRPHKASNYYKRYR